MKRILVILCFLVLSSPIVYATPIDWVVGDDSSVTLEGNTVTNTFLWWTIGGASISGTLLADGAGTLEDGETAKIDFFSLTVDSWGTFGGGEYDISATLDLDVPDVSGTGTGGGYFGSIAGVINGGTLFWDESSLPDVFTLSDGTIFSIDFESGIALGLDDTATVHAYLTNHGRTQTNNPVPEPATVLLMGAGLIGMVVAGRKRLIKKS